MFLTKERFLLRNLNWSRTPPSDPSGPENYTVLHCTALHCTVYSLKDPAA